MPYEKEEDERSEINRDHEVVMGCKRVFFEEHEFHEFHECTVRKFLLIAIEFHEYAVRNVFASRFVKEISLKFPERDEVHSPMASECTSGALGE